MFIISVKDEFSGAHNLRGYEGKCEKLHGHNWKVEVAVGKNDLDDTGMVTDFKVLKKQLNAVLDGLDHKYLNDLPCFSSSNPTSENIARYIYEELTRSVENVLKVTVWETDTSKASYFK